jgi:ribonuclease BN (tRNA processing enzyme)
LLVLDAGTGIRRLGAALAGTCRRVDILLTHLHMDHIQGLGFFEILHDPEVDVHIWGPVSPAASLRRRLARYLSPPLFPVRLRDIPRLTLHEVADEEFTVGGAQITAAYVCHPNPTLGYRIQADGAAVTYLPDHEPALGAPRFPLSPEWTSGYALAAATDLLIHDAQYTAEEYNAHIGWGHSSLSQALAFAACAGVKHLVPFHHDPTHTDDDIDRMMAEALRGEPLPFAVTPATAGATFTLGA